MVVVAVALAKDEADVVEGWVRHMTAEVDHVIVADNMSTDGTREILDKLVGEGLPLTVVDDDEVAYRQSVKVSILCALASVKFDAVWLLPADLDELHYSRRDRIRDVLLHQPPWVTTVHIPLFNHLATALDGPEPDPFRRMVWRQPRPGGLPKVAFRWQDGAVVDQGNHGVTLPRPGLVALEPDLLEIRHFPIRSADHMIRKARNGAAAYAAAPDLPEDYGRHWRAWGQILDTYGEAGIRDAFQEHWFYRSPVDAGLVHDPPPYRRWE